MNLISGIFVYFLTWWVVIFCTLPFGLRDEESKGGSMPGAPREAKLKQKLIWTTIVAAIVWVIIDLIIVYGGISFHDMAARMSM